MPSLRRPSEPASTSRSMLSPLDTALASSVASSASTIRGSGRDLSPDLYTHAAKFPHSERQRSSSFGTATTSGSRMGEADRLFAVAAQKLRSSTSSRGTPRRTQSGKEERLPGSPLLTSPSAHSVASLASSMASRPAPPNVYDSMQMKVAIERFESAHKLDGKGGELGYVGAVGFGGDDAWQTVTVKVLPLWNNDPLNGYIEDLNEVVQRHIKRIIDRSPSHAIDYLTEHFQELLTTGMLTLGAKLSYLEDNEFLRKLDEVWMSFFNRILPYLEAIFLPFTTNLELRKLSKNKALSRSPIDAPRLTSLFLMAAHLEEEQAQRLNASRRSSQASTASTGRTPRASIYRNSLPIDVSIGDSSLRTQMIGLVASVQTEDDNQEAIERLVRAIRGDVDLLDPEGERTVSPSTQASDSEEDVRVDTRRGST